MKKVLAVFVLVLSTASQSFGWGNAGHETVTYLAYQHLTAATRAKVDALVALDPCYSQWKTTVASLPAAQQGAGLFMLALSCREKPTSQNRDMGHPPCCWRGGWEQQIPS